MEASKARLAQIQQAELANNGVFLYEGTYLSGQQRTGLGSGGMTPMQTIEAEWAFWKATQTNSTEDQRAQRHDGIVRHLSARAVLETVFTRQQFIGDRNPLGKHKRGVGFLMCWSGRL